MIAGRTLQGWLDRADVLGAAGRFFDAHEELEAGWKAAEGSEKILLQGVIQLAAGLHRLTLDADDRDGAEELFDRGLAKLREGRALITADSLAVLEAALRAARASPKAPGGFRFGLRTR